MHLLLGCALLFVLSKAVRPASVHSARERYVPTTEVPLSTQLTSTTEPSPSSSMTTVTFVPPSESLISDETETFVPFSIIFTVETETFVPPSATLSSDETKLTSPINIERVKTEEVVTLYTTTETPKEECFCEYPEEDARIIAHADGKRLIFGDRVRKGSSVIFRCRREGFHRFRGRREIACSDCKPWHSSEMPNCTLPNRGDAVILLDNDVAVLPNGDIEIPKGKRLNLTCAAMQIATYPKWSAPVVSGISVIHDRKVREYFGDVAYLAYLEIQNATYDMEGSYECSIGGKHESTIHVKITGRKCEQLKASDFLSIEYRGDRAVGSLAVFFCATPGKRKGVPHTRCLENGTWKDPIPICIGDVSCPEFPSFPGLDVTYSKNMSVGSVAKFSCLPSTRHLVGSPVSTCQETGSWSSHLPSCEDTKCSIRDLLKSISEDVELDITDVTGDFKANSVVGLKCRDYSVINGNANVVCGEDGKWKLGNYDCALGCVLNIDSSSHLLAHPVKDSYRFGEFVVLKCARGYLMTKNIERMMCLGSTWSDSLPSCKPWRPLGDRD